MPAGYASQGEQRSLALAVRLAGHVVISDVVGEPPVLLLDDVFSELDETRANNLVAHMPIAQALVTTAGALPPGLPAERVVWVAGGRSGRERGREPRSRAGNFKKRPWEPSARSPRRIGEALSEWPPT